MTRIVVMSLSATTVMLLVCLDDDDFKATPSGFQVSSCRVKHMRAVLLKRNNREPLTM